MTKSKSKIAKYAYGYAFRQNNDIHQFFVIVFLRTNQLVSEKLKVLFHWSLSDFMYPPRGEIH